ncbi:MAG TPA: hypothetical protein VMZ69_09510 [Saprospiraceae bacterium]|nr:hypothetical protein [Saprospiraceae bacterium]
MPNTDLHIVSFAVPYPATYGGAIDVLNRIKALHKEGVRIKLHCFLYGRFNPHNALNETAEEVHYYPRITWPAILAPGMPYIVASRKNPKLLERLNEDKAPILFEGIHTTGFVDEIQNRKKLLRAHNIEHKYYGHLANDSQRFQYLFFQRESLALERYEGNHARAFDTVFPISLEDQKWYKEKGANCAFMPAYHGLENIDIKTGKGTYLLYQGDLSIESNQRAVIELLRAPGIDQFPVVIAGKEGERSFEEKLTKYSNLRREVDVSEEKMASLIRDAQIVMIHSRHSSGMKVKIFPALYNGRFVIANENSVTNTALDKAMHIYKNVNELAGLCDKLWQLEVNDQLISERKETLIQLPDDRQKAKTILQCL